MNNSINLNDLLMEALSGLATDKTVSASDAIVFSSELVETLISSIDPDNSLALTCPNADIDPSYGNRESGHMPSTQPFGESDTSVKPLGTPSASSIIEKIDTKTKAKTMNILLHSFWRMLNANDQNEIGFNKEKLIETHIALVEKMKSKGWVHQYMDSFDDTLPAHLRGTIVGPANPPKDKADGNERESITVAPAESSEPTTLKVDAKLNVALPEVVVDKDSYFKLKKQDINQILGDEAADEITASLPDDALYLLVDAVETGVFNKVEITKQELENAAPGYAGRMFVEGHDWNNPQKAIGQILKATVVFSPQKSKWVMRVLAVILKEDAIKNFERGLYKFVSIGATMKAICSVCGLTVQEGCRHIKGMVYEGANGTKIECKYKAVDLQMEELSAVNVPACRTASAYGRVSREQARDLLAASLGTTSGEELVALEAAIELQEIIYGEHHMESKNNIADWQKEFRICDAQGYNSLMQEAAGNIELSKTYNDLVAHRNISKKEENLIFAHSLLHRWFNQPNRIHGWTEDAIAKMHCDIEAELLGMGVEQLPEVSVMDSILHAKAESLKDGGAGAASVSPAAAPAAGDSGADVALKFPVSDDEDELNKPKKDGSGNGQRANKGRGGCDSENDNGQGKCKASSEEKEELFSQNKKNENSDVQQKCDDEMTEEDEENEENCKKNKKTFGANKIFNKNNIVDSENDDNEEEDEQEMQNEDCNKNPDVKQEAVSLSDGLVRRAGYQDGVSKAQAGETKAKGKDQNLGADLPVKGAEYRKGYETGYKEAGKNAEPDYVDDQISKTGGTEMAVENTEKVVLEKAQKDEAKKSGAVKDFGTRKEQGVAKPEVKYSDADAKHERAEEKGETNSTHEYDAKEGHAKAEVQYKEQKQDGDNYGYLKCPKCNQGNIMQETKKCPNCGAPHSELIPIKEEERLGDFPYMKTHTAYDAPPMEAKTPGVATPAAQKSKLAQEDQEDVVSSIKTEMRLMKEHISKITNQSEAERDTWYAERRELVNANQSLSEALTATQEDIDTIRLDLDTKTSMYKTLLEEHQALLRQVEEHANFAKKQLVDEIVSSKINLGLIDDENVNDQSQLYMEKSIETLRVLQEEMAANSQRISDIVLQSKFGVPKGKELDGDSETTEGVKVSKGETVESKEEAKKQQDAADKMATQEEIDEAAKELGELKQGAVKQSNTIMAQVRRSLTNNRRTR